ncbi:alpha/beta fold hydrolase [Amycolatopsis anabasis]|uniref:alpha/beta fold hydrolase n=1 Tax=Amycolatopsis anabasis TaxID=1840409 RepID=UPI00131C89F5|nr:alpha/beta fold hydrolase [Amycolatopsis anabasis]
MIRELALAALLAPVTPAAADGGLHWTPCATPQTAPRLECASLEVPVDWARPDGAKLTLKLNRLPARKPAERIGPIFVNPGGPGGATTDVVAYNGMIAGYPETQALADRFDIIGFDPRGVGGSAPVRCGTAKLHDPGVSAFPRDRAGFDALVAFNRAAGRACLEGTGPLLGHVDTISVARDMDAIRAALGEAEVSFYGTSYGTEIGEIYADLFGAHLRSMVLDAPVDHALPSTRAAVDEAAATEDAFTRFAAWCRGNPECAVSGSDVPRLVDGLFAAPVPARELGRDATAEELSNGIYGYLNLWATWPMLGTALAAATAPQPDASALLKAARFTGPDYPAYRAVGCQDFAAPLGPRDVARQEHAMRAAAPRMWRYAEFWDFASGCAGWPVPPANPPAPRLVTGVPPVLVIGGTHDPATPLPWARGLSRRIAGSALLIDERDGHSALLNSPCGRARAADYLVSGVTPAPGAICAPSREQGREPAR